MKRILSIALVLVLAFGFCAIAAAEPEEGRVIKVLVGNHSYDMNTDPVAKILKDVTGYDVEYGYIADDNALALEVAPAQSMT